MLAGNVIAAPRTVAVAIENMRFDPVALTVSPGDRIVWVNKDPVPHTVSADGLAFNSGEIASGASWTYVAKRPGELPYHCAYHPAMKGKLIVTGAEKQT
ncbi:MAG TPA: cupredoxin family copper-binding protein [Solirubrobacteraceae bacterium]|nr:cupredoxin family copper-binding protein [Solirubrobacteraceae bacterium]